VFRYKLHFEDGTEAGDAAYMDFVNVGEFVWLGPGVKLLVVDAVPVEEEDSPYTALLKVEAA
jgi:hypothetical protein